MAAPNLQGELLENREHRWQQGLERRRRRLAEFIAALIAGKWFTMFRTPEPCLLICDPYHLPVFSEVLVRDYTFDSRLVFGLELVV